MQDRFNTIAGWTLFAGIVALGSSIASGLYFQADKPHRPHEMGFPIEGVVEPGAEEGPDLGTFFDHALDRIAHLVRAVRLVGEEIHAAGDRESEGDDAREKCPASDGVEAIGHVRERLPGFRLRAL